MTRRTFPATVLVHGNAMPLALPPGFRRFSQAFDARVSAYAVIIEGPFTRMPKGGLKLVNLHEPPAWQWTDEDGPCSEVIPVPVDEPRPAPPPTVAC